MPDADGRDEARAALGEYLALSGQMPRTIAQWIAQGPSDNPTFRKQADRLTGGLRKAGMPEE